MEEENKEEVDAMKIAIPKIKSAIEGMTLQDIEICFEHILNVIKDDVPVRFKK